jgi:hypothetical protein
MAVQLRLPCPVPLWLKAPLQMAGYVIFHFVWFTACC